MLPPHYFHVKTDASKTEVERIKKTLKHAGKGVRELFSEQRPPDSDAGN